MVGKLAIGAMSISVGTFCDGADGADGSGHVGALANGVCAVGSWPEAAIGAGAVASGDGLVILPPKSVTS